MILSALLLAISAITIYFSLVWVSPKNADKPKIVAFLAAQHTLINLINTHLVHSNSYLGWLAQFAVAAALLHIIFSTDYKDSAITAGIYLVIKVGVAAVLTRMPHNLFH